MTTEFLEGDLVEAVKGTTTMRGYVTRHLWLGDTRRTIQGLSSDGFTLTLIERPKPKVELPTEPGYYLSGSSDEVGLLQLLGTGEWYWVGNRYMPNPEKMVADRVAEYHMTLTRLESRADTAKAVIDAIRSVSRSDGGYYEHQLFERELRSIAAEFGVTND